MHYVKGRCMLVFSRDGYRGLHPSKSVSYVKTHAIHELADQINTGFDGKLFVSINPWQCKKIYDL